MGKASLIDVQTCEDELLPRRSEIGGRTMGTEVSFHYINFFVDFVWISQNRHQSSWERRISKYEQLGVGKIDKKIFFNGPYVCHLECCLVHCIVFMDIPVARDAYKLYSY